MSLIEAYMNLLNVQRESYGGPGFLIMPMRDFEVISMRMWQEEKKLHLDDEAVPFGFITHLNGVPVWAIRAPGSGTP
jgi:hypothetical protein